MSGTLYIAARAPRPGFAKTRLGKVIGHDSATTLYRAFLRDLATRFEAAPFEVGWYVTPPDAWVEVALLVGAYARGARMLTQGQGSWTQRQRELFKGAAERGEGRVVLIASDSPHLGLETVEAAFAELDRHDLVFGPTHDGGYYLIGMRGWCDVFGDTPMSTGTVLTELLARARQLGLSVAQIEVTFDVDEAEDLMPLREEVLLRSDMPATRAVLASLGYMDVPALQAEVGIQELQHSEARLSSQRQTRMSTAAGDVGGGAV